MHEFKFKLSATRAYRAIYKFNFEALESLFFILKILLHETTTCNNNAITLTYGHPTLKLNHHQLEMARGSMPISQGMSRDSARIFKFNGIVERKFTFCLISDGTVDA